LPPGADAVLETHTHFDEPTNGEAPAADARRGDADGEGRRRSRDRYGRDRRERGERSERPLTEEVALGAEVSAEEQQHAFAVDRAPQGNGHDRARGAERADGATDRAPSREQPAAAPQPAGRSSVPRVRPYQLPIDDLKNVAEGSGLQWVLSDAEKIAAAQAAIAAEPRPVRVPRERPPVVASDEGPLVLVETKRDLRNLQLPF